MIQRTKIDGHKVKFCENDISNKCLKQAKSSGIVTWDIETSGLDWRNGKIALCQLWIPPDIVKVVKISNDTPKNM